MKDEGRILLKHLPHADFTVLPLYRFTVSPAAPLNSSLVIPFIRICFRFTAAEGIQYFIYWRESGKYEVRTTKYRASQRFPSLRPSSFVLRPSYFVPRTFFNPATTTASPPIPAISTTANTSPKAHRFSPPSKSTTPTTPISSTWRRPSGCC